VREGVDRARCCRMSSSYEGTSEAGAKSIVVSLLSGPEVECMCLSLKI